MRRNAGVGAIALAMVTAAGGAFGAPRCAASGEVTAIQAEVVHELLMNAGLYCGNAGRDKYNAYQARYIPERLRTSATLMRMFRRLNPGRLGESDYHAFTTRVANNYSIHAIRDNAEFCHTADIVFDAAMIADKPSLASFVSGIEVTEQGPVDSCQLRVAVGLKDVLPPVVPKPNPMRVAALAPTPAAPAANAVPPNN